MVHNVALVLGGGGTAGQAWQIGVIAGLAEAGFDLTEAADLVVGTSSSGSTTAAQRMRAIGAAATSAAELRRAMGAFGLESDSILGPGAGQRRAMVAARLPRAEWPDRPMIVVAVDAHTGELAAFDRSLHQRWRALQRKRRPCLRLRERRGALAVRRTEPDTTGTGRGPGRPGRGPAQISGRSPSKPGRGPAQARQPRRGDHTGRRFPSRNGHKPDGPGDPHPRRPCRFHPRQEIETIEGSIGTVWLTRAEKSNNSGDSDFESC